MNNPSGDTASEEFIMEVMSLKERKRKPLKVIGIVAAIIILILAAGLIAVTRGLSEMQELVINEVDLTKIPDGIYAGEFSRYRWSNTVQVSVEDHKILAINTTNAQKLEQELTSRIITQQSLQVDITSGATVSSKAFLKAVEDALSINQ